MKNINNYFKRASRQIGTDIFLAYVGHKNSKLADRKGGN